MAELRVEIGAQGTGDGARRIADNGRRAGHAEPNRSLNEFAPATTIRAGDKRVRAGDKRVAPATLATPVLWTPAGEVEIWYRSGQRLTPLRSQRRRIRLGETMERRGSSRPGILVVKLSIRPGSALRNHPDSVGIHRIESQHNAYQSKA